jgi:hypothetical protein
VKNSVPGRTWRVWVDGGKPEEAHSGGRWQRGWILIIIIILIRRLSGWWFGTMEFHDCPFSWEWKHHPNWL